LSTQRLLLQQLHLAESLCLCGWLNPLSVSLCTWNTSPTHK